MKKFTADTMISVSSLLLTLVLFSELSSRLVATDTEDGVMERGGLRWFGDELMTEPGGGLVDKVIVSVSG